DAGAYRSPARADVLAEHAHAAARRADQAAHDVEERGLAGAVRPDDAHHGAGRDAKREAVERAVLTEHALDVRHLDGRVARPVADGHRPSISTSGDLDVALVSGRAGALAKS